MLKLSNIKCHYGRVAALRGVSLEINQGEIACLIGANGAGKSTTLNAISGLIKPTSGRIDFMGERIDNLKPEKIVRKSISQVPEGRKVFPDMTVLENLKLGAYIFSDKARIRANLEKMYDYFPRLSERKNQLAGTLSGGEQQMLAIGRALMSEPKLLLLDEPSLGLSPILLQEIGAILQDLHKLGITILVVEQKAFVLKYVTRGYVLENGVIPLQAKSDELLSHPEIRKAYLGL